VNPETHTNVTHIVDGVAAVIAVASLASILPPLAAMFTIAWTGLRIYEMVYGAPFADSRLAKWMTGRA